MAAIHVRNLSKYFGEARVLEHIELSIQPGEMFFLLGPSGCGKTTLLRHIAGFYTPDEGSIWFGEQDVTRQPPHQRGTAMMFQSYALWPHLTVAGNVAFGLEQRNLPARDIAARVKESLSIVQLEGLADRRIQQLSGGQQQRVALARSLVVRPHCLLLDEPLSNLDTRLRLDMRTEIRRICKDFGLTAVYVTHDQEEALSMADRLAVMAGGQLVQVGAPLEVYRNPVNRMVAGFIGETNFIPAQVSGKGSRPGTVMVESPVGPLLARIDESAWQPVAGTHVTLSVRPESLHLGDPELTNRLPGIVADATYLGSTAQYRLRLNDHLAVSITELNPAGTLRKPGENAVASVTPDDVIVLPE